MSAPWRLRVERGPNSGQSYPIDRASATIGRQENNAIVLDDARLSRQHARIETGPQGLTVTDLNSANGTLVNGRPVTGTVPLNPGDRLQLGDTVMVVEGGPPAPLGGPSAPLGDPNATMFAGGPGGGLPASAPAAETPRLVVQGTGTIYRLDRPSMVIGRQPENELPLDDSQASRQHARIETRDGQVTITDLNSANGTRVNGTRINAPTVLNNGDLVQIGTSQLRVEGIAFIDHGTAIALGFFPPPPSGPALGGAAPLGGPPPASPPLAGGVAFDGPLIEGATVMGAPPPMGGAPPLGAPPPMGGPQPMGGPPIIGGPPPGVPGAPGQPWNAPLAPQFGGAPPPIQPPMPPATPARRRSGPSPLLLIGGGAILLLICIGVGVGAFALSRRDNNADPTATAVRAAGTPASVAASASSSAGTPLPASGNSGGNSAPPAPGATPVSSSAGTPTGSARPAATPSTAAQPSTPAGQQRIEIAEVGLVFNLPSDWKQVAKDSGSVQFASGDNRAQIVVRWVAKPPSSVTAQSIILDELDSTAATDPNFDPAVVRTGTAQISGLQGFGTDPYTFKARDGNIITEADRAVVVAGKAQYFFGFLALQTAFESYGPTFDQIIATIKIT